MARTFQALNIALYFATQLGGALVLLFPALCLAAWRRPRLGRFVPTAAAVVGVLFLWDFLFISVSIGLLMWHTYHPTPGVFILDWNPFPERILFALNWLLPAAAVGLLAALPHPSGFRQTRRFLIGLSLFLPTAAAYLLLGWYVFSRLPVLLRENVWWL